MAHQLPSETLSEIFEKLAIDDLLSVCRVSRAWKSESTRHIYQKLEFHELHTGRIWKCFDTLARNMGAAKSVRSLTIRKDHFCKFKRCCRKHRMPPSLAMEQAESFYTTLKRLSSTLTNLVFDDTPKQFLELLPADCAFPRLQELDFNGVSITPNTLSFIRNSQELKKLIMMLDEIPSTPIEKIHLPRLSQLYAPPNIISAIMSGSINGILKRVDVLANPINEYLNNQQESRDALMALSSRYTLEHLGVHGVPMAGSDYFSFLARTYPGIESLTLDVSCALITYPVLAGYNIMPVVGDLNTDEISAVLPLFKCIKKLEFCRRSEWFPFRGEVHTVAHEFAVLKEWSHLAKSLKICRMPSGIVWARKDQGDWVPVTKTRKCAPWCKERIREVPDYQSTIKDVRASNWDIHEPLYYDPDRRLTKCVVTTSYE